MSSGWEHISIEKKKKLVGDSAWRSARRLLVHSQAWLPGRAFMLQPWSLFICVRCSKSAVQVLSPLRKPFDLAHAHRDRQHHSASVLTSQYRFRFQLFFLPSLSLMSHQRWAIYFLIWAFASQTPFLLLCSGAKGSLATANDYLTKRTWEDRLHDSAFKKHNDDETVTESAFTGSTFESEIPESSSYGASEHGVSFDFQRLQIQTRTFKITLALKIVWWVKMFSAVCFGAWLNYRRASFEASSAPVFRSRTLHAGCMLSGFNNLSNLYLGSLFCPW